ncbi:MAG: hypothetical protein JHD16_16860 [Solirubrobacteraceae bacterium]|nr:hypothetical protein [Solirubrobacteraceae bacterium]
MPKTSSRHRRRAIGAALIAIGLLGASATGASAAEIQVKLRTSTSWAVAGLPVTVTVTSSQSGKLWISQARLDGTKPIGNSGGTCAVTPGPLFRDVPGTPVTITAGTPLKFKIQPGNLRFFDGELFPSSSAGCWFSPTPYKWLYATVFTETPEVAMGESRVSFSRIL